MKPEPAEENCRPQARDDRGAAAREALDELSRVNSEMADLQRELARSNAALRRLDEQKSLLLGMAAHDLRTPIGVILTFSEVIEEDAGSALGADHREFLSIIRSTSAFMLRLVDDVLDLATIESGRLDLDVQVHDLAAIVERQARLHDVLARRKDVRVEQRASADESLRRVPLDAVRFERVLDNVIGNAVKFSPPGSSVTVTLGLDGDQAWISVADDGPGLAPGDAERIFKPFVKTGSRGSAGETSTGLGLAIARQVVEAHGGSIRAGNGERGAVFTVRLPAGDPRGSSRSRAAGDDRRNG